MAPMMLTSVVALGLAVHPAFPGGRPALQPRATFLQPKLARHVAPSAQAVAETDELEGLLACGESLDGRLQTSI